MVSPRRSTIEDRAIALDELPLVLNISETARALGLHRSTVARMIRDGRLQSSGRAGDHSQVLISKRAIATFLDGVAGPGVSTP